MKEVRLEEAFDEAKLSEPTLPILPILPIHQDHVLLETHGQPSKGQVSLSDPNSIPSYRHD